MIIKVHSDGSFLSAQGSRSREVWHFYFGNDTPMQQDEPYQGASYEEFILIKPIVALVTEYEKLTLFSIDKLQ